MSQASSHWDTEDVSELASPRTRQRLDDTDVSDQVGDDSDDDENVATEMGKYLSESGPLWNPNDAGLKTIPENSISPINKEMKIVTEVEKISRKSSSSSLNQQNPGDWLGVEPVQEVRKTEALASASEISMPASSPAYIHIETTSGETENPPVIASRPHRLRASISPQQEISENGEPENGVDFDENDENLGSFQPMIDNLFSWSRTSITGIHTVSNVFLHLGLADA